MLMKNKAEFIMQAMDLPTSDLIRLNKDIEQVCKRAMEEDPKLNIDVTDCFYMSGYLPMMYERIANMYDVAAAILSGAAYLTATFSYNKRANGKLRVREPKKAHFHTGLVVYDTIEVSSVYYPFEIEDEQYRFQICQLNCSDDDWCPGEFIDDRTICSELKSSKKEVIRYADLMVKIVMDEIYGDRNMIKYNKREQTKKLNEILEKAATRIREMRQGTEGENNDIF